MSNHRVKITFDEDGEKIPWPKWCLVVSRAGSPMALCSGQYFGYGEGCAKYIEDYGDITCPNCRDNIKEIKAVKL